MSEPSNLTPMKLPSLLTTLSRHFKQRELNRAHERLAEISAMIGVISDRAGYKNGAWKDGVYSMIELRGEHAKLTARRDRLEKELGLVRATD